MIIFRRLHYVPISLVLVFYLPAAVLGLFAFKDKYAVDLLLILLIFSSVYIFVFRWAVIFSEKVRGFLVVGRAFSFNFFWFLFRLSI